MAGGGGRVNLGASLLKETAPMTCGSVIPVVATVVGAAVGIFSPIALEGYKRKRDCQMTAAALAASIAGILKRTREYRFVETARDALARLERGESVRMKGVLLHGPLEEPILEKHYDKIGLLGRKLSRDVIAFYGYVTALRLDLVRLFEGAFDDDPERMAEILRHGLDLWSREEPKAHALVKRLKKAAR